MGVKEQDIHLNEGLKTTVIITGTLPGAIIGYFFGFSRKRDLR
jgi:hypothetical protein